MGDDSEGSVGKGKAALVVLRGGAQPDSPLNKCWSADIVIGQVSGDRLMELSVGGIHDAACEVPCLLAILPGNCTQVRDRGAALTDLAFEVGIVLSGLLGFAGCDPFGCLLLADALDVLVVM